MHHSKFVLRTEKRTLDPFAAEGGDSAFRWAVIASPESELAQKDLPSTCFPGSFATPAWWPRRAILHKARPPMSEGLDMNELIGNFPGVGPVYRDTTNNFFLVRAGV